MAPRDGQQTIDRKRDAASLSMLRERNLDTVLPLPGWSRVDRGPNKREHDIAKFVEELFVNNVFGRCI